MAERSDSYLSGKRLAAQATAWAGEGKRVLVYLRGAAQPFSADIVEHELFIVTLRSSLGTPPVLVATDSIEAVSFLE